MDRISDYGVDFNDFEQWCFDMGNAFARMLMQTVLSELDDRLLRERDKGEYRAKDKRRRAIKTLMGEFDLERRMYKRSEAAGGGYVYLLDEAIGLDTIGKISNCLFRRIAETITECSYRATSETVSLMTGQGISHMGIWNVVQAVGAQIDELDARRAKLAKLYPDSGDKIVKVLQEEFDGVWINMQGKDRPKKGRKAEMKVAMSYEGVTYAGKSKAGKPVYNLVNPLYMTGFESPEKFFEKKEGQLAEVYNLDEIEIRLVNGDGGSWIQSVAERGGENVHMQLDPFHVKREIKRSGLSKEGQAQLEKLLNGQRVSEALTFMEESMQNTACPDIKEKIKKTLTYLKNNRDCLIPVMERGLELPPPPDDAVYGNMGAMEGGIGNLVALRMKRRKASFTKAGAGNLARLICAKRSSMLDDTIRKLSQSKLPMPIEGAITIILSAAKAPKKDGNGYGYPVIGGIPFKDTFTTNGRQAVKGLTDYRGFTELVLR